MFYIRHYTIYPYYDNLKTVLEKEHNIQVDDKFDVFTGDLIGMHFSVSEQHPRFDEIDRILPLETKSDQLKKQREHFESTGEVIRDFVMIIYEEQYSKEELDRAKWIKARNITPKIDPENSETVDSYQCFVKHTKLGRPVGRHEIQAESYIIKSPIKWGRSAFVSAYAHEERLFCNDTIYNLMQGNDIRGFRVRPVLRKSNQLPIDGIHQIEALYTTPDFAIKGISGMTEYACQQCGMHMLRHQDGKGRYGIVDGVLDDTVDIWITPPMFLGRGESADHSAQSALIISQKMYRFLVDNKLDRGFVFVPLEPISS